MHCLQSPVRPVQLLFTIDLVVFMSQQKLSIFPPHHPDWPRLTWLMIIGHKAKYAARQTQTEQNRKKRNIFTVGPSPNFLLWNILLRPNSVAGCVKVSEFPSVLLYYCFSMEFLVGIATIITKPSFTLRALISISNYYRPIDNCLSSLYCISIPCW